MPFVNIFAGRRSNARILKHHRTSDVYIDGRYLHASMKISLKSKRGLEVARETALTILEAVGDAERDAGRSQTVVVGHEQSTGRPIEEERTSTPP